MIDQHTDYAGIAKSDFKEKFLKAEKWVSKQAFNVFKKTYKIEDLKYPILTGNLKLASAG